MLAVGDVIVLYDGLIDSPKNKFFLCVSVEDGWYLRINTQSHWKPHFMLSATENTCLDHDSFLELRGVIEHDDLLIEESIADDARNRRGRLTDDTLVAFAAMLPGVKTLTVAKKERILERIAAVLDQG